MLADEATAIKPSEVIDFLRTFRFLDNYILSLYQRKEGKIVPLRPRMRECEVFGKGLSCGKACHDICERAARLAIDRGRPVVFRCNTGLLFFAVSLDYETLPGCCILGGGLREKPMDLSRMEAAALRWDTNPFKLLEKLDSLPSASIDEVKEAARKVRRLIGSLQKENLQSRLLEKTVSVIRAVSAVSSEIDRSNNAEEAVYLFVEALSVLFDIRKILIPLFDEYEGWKVAVKTGIPEEVEGVSLGMLGELFDCPSAYGAVADIEWEQFFPGLSVSKGLSIPLNYGEELLGVVGLFDSEIAARDIPVLELLAGKLCVKLAILRKEEERKRQATDSRKVVDILGGMSVMNSEEVYRRILQTASDLTDASSGSVMRINDNGTTLHIEAVKGINPRLAGNMHQSIGTGIAGKVAMEGEPVVVDDIENDSRFGMPNRSRFKTRSFICMPIKARGVTRAILSLADKKDGGPFTKADLDVLTSMLNQAALILERTESERKAETLENLSMTDPETGLFNRRYLQLRLEEEFNRCTRYSQELALMMIRLDRYDIYCNLCGSIAGQTALKKAAGVINDSARTMDVITYLGNGTFSVLLPETAQRESCIVAERIRGRISRTVFVQEDNLPSGTLTASIGIASLADDCETAEAIFAAAHAALERAGATCDTTIHSNPDAVAAGKVIPIKNTQRQK